VDLSVLAYNLHILGNCLIAQEKSTGFCEQKQEKRLKKQAGQHRQAA